MKKKFTYSIIAFLMGLSLFSCEELVQSELNFADIKDSARVEGVVYYDQGDLGTETNLPSTQYSPAANVKVLIKVPYEGYSSSAEGVKIFEVMTSAEGQYSVLIPVGGATVQAEVEVVPFEASHYVYTNESTQVLPTVLYDVQSFLNGGTGSIPLQAGDIADRNILMEPTNLPYGNNLTNLITIKGTVYCGREELDKISDDLYRCYLSENCDVYVEIKKTDPGTDERVLRFSGESVGEGMYAIDAKFYESWSYDDVTITVTAKDFVDVFEHYYRLATGGTSPWRDQSLTGVFKQQTVYDVLSLGDKLLGIRMPDIEMSFEPENTFIIRGIGNPNVDVNHDDGFNLYHTYNPWNWSWE